MEGKNSMNTKTIYICENCGKEFDEYHDCEMHESICCNKHQKYRDNVANAVEQAKEKYKSIITSITYKTDADVDKIVSYEPDLDLYKYIINIKLSNGNKFTVYDGCDEDSTLGNYLDTEAIFKSLDRAITDRLEMTYEGIIHVDTLDGWYVPKIGDMEIFDIAKRLDGRKVRLEVIK